MNDSFNQQLRAMLNGAGATTGVAPGAPTMPGIPAQSGNQAGAAQAGDEMTMRAYRLYSAEAQKNGDQVVPFEEFRAAVMAQQQQVAGQQMPPAAAQPAQITPPGGLGAVLGGLR